MSFIQMPDELPRIPKKRRPRNKPRSDAWLQQNLNAYRPSFTFRCALPVIASTAAVCWGMGITLIYNNSKAIEHEIDYTDCSNGGDLWQTKVEDSKKICTHEFHLEQEYKGDVTFYYGLDGFYQNIRKYHQSRNDHQLRSHDLRATEDCYPYEHSKVNGRELPIVPCGAVANSMFNDTFTLYRVIDGNHVKVDWTALDIVDPRFREKKYKNPKTCRGNITTCPGFENTAKPEDWTRHIAEIGDVETGRALENADFIIWMETSALPNFRKVYRKLRVLPANENKDGLNVGRYVLEIVDNFPTKNWNGRKKFIIESQGPLGPKALFQTIAYVTLSVVLTLLTLFMFIMEYGGVTFVKGREFCSNIHRRFGLQTIDGL